MFKNIALALPAVLLAATTVTAQCTNYACQVANAIYKECKYARTNTGDFQTCLCTEKFLVNYKRCIGGTICSWDGDPSTLNQPCMTVYCPGTFDGGFDAIEFCRGIFPTGYPASSSTARTSTTSTKSTPVVTKTSTSTSRTSTITPSSTTKTSSSTTKTSTKTSSSTRPVITHNTPPSSTKSSSSTKTSTSTRPVIT